MHRAFVAECLGTFVLTLAVLMSSAIPTLLPTPVLASLVVMVFVYAIGGISGAHLNPAVTIGLLSVKKVTLTQAIHYILAQFLGAMLALLLATLAGLVLRPVGPVSIEIYLFELLGTAILTFGIAAVVYNPDLKVASGLLIGSSLLLGIIIAVVGGTSGILNPAVGAALQNMIYPYYIVQILGGILGFQVYVYLNKPQKKDK